MKLFIVFKMSHSNAGFNLKVIIWYTKAKPLLSKTIQIPFKTFEQGCLVENLSVEKSVEWHFWQFG